VPPCFDSAISSYSSTSALALGPLSLTGTIIYFGANETTLVQQGLGSGGWERVIVYPPSHLADRLWKLPAREIERASTRNTSLSPRRSRFAVEPRSGTGGAREL
jgi:hypothetical protein